MRPSRKLSYTIFFTLLKPYSGLFVCAVFLMLLSAIFDGMSLSVLVPVSDRILAGKKIVFPYQLPVILDEFVNKLNTVAPRRMLFYVGVAVLVLFLLKASVEFLYKYLMSDIGQRIIRDLRYKIYSKIQRLPMSFYSKYRSGELISRITSDVAIVENAVAYGTAELFYQGMQVLVFSSIVLFIDWKFSLWLLILIPLVVFPIRRIGRVLKKLTHKSQEKIADISSVLFETISGIRIVKAFVMEDIEIERFAAHNQEYYRLTMKEIARRLLTSPLLEVVSAVVAVVILWYGGNRVLSGEISFGVFAFFLASLLSLVRPLKRLSSVHMFYQKALGALERIYEILDQEVEKITFCGTKCFVFNKEIKFDDVWFRYDREWVLKGISFSIPKGKIVALVGFSGSGKSTIASLLLGFYEPQKGNILIDGVDLREFDVRQIRENIGYVTQDTVLFNSTIEENIRYGTPDASRDAVKRASIIANADGFIRGFEKGYDTNIGDLGNKLSGGQKQRIAIARAVIKDPPILILDEATSHLDLQSEQEVQHALKTVMKGRTVLIIAHRLSTIRDADIIVVLHQGSIIEVGTHSELMQRDGLYRSLYRLQGL